MSTDERKNKNAASRERVAELVALLLAEGWKDVSRPLPADSLSERWQWVDLEDPEGRRFSLQGGSWGREGAITAKVAGIEFDGLKVHYQDVARGTAPEASGAHTRTAAALLKDFKRRVFAAPEGIEAAHKVRDGMARQVAARERLRGHVQTLRLLGYSEGEHKENETYSLAMWSPGSEPYKVTVYENGRVAFEGSCDVGQFAAVRACLNTPQSNT